MLVLIGLAASTILPSLMPKDSGVLMQKEARRLILLSQTAREQALIKGRDMGLQQTDTGYRFLVFQESQWQPIPDLRLLSPVEIGDAFRIEILPGESVWRESLEYEKGNGFTFEDSDDEQSEENITTPDLYFWASGENSPAEIQLSSASDSGNRISILVDESGSISQAEETPE